MKRKNLEFPLEVLREKSFYLNYKKEQAINNDICGEYFIEKLDESIKQLDFAIKLIELQIEYDKIK